MSFLRRFRKARPSVTDDISWLTEDLGLCAAPSAGDWPSIYEAGVRSVVDLRAEGTDNAVSVQAQGMRYLRVPIAEYEAPTDAELRLITQWAMERIPDGPVLVHCREGRGRSALVACAVLVRLGLPLRDAYQRLVRFRPQASLSQPQIEILERFAAANGPAARTDASA